MRFFIILILAAAGCLDRPCPGNSCEFADAPPYVDVEIARIWNYYNEFNDANRAVDGAPSSSLFTWVRAGDCDSRYGFWVDDLKACKQGDTNVSSYSSLPSTVNFVFLMTGSERSVSGVLHHELMHVWLAQSGVVPDADAKHKHPYWQTLVPDAQSKIDYFNVNEFDSRQLPPAEQATTPTPEPANPVAPPPKPTPTPKPY